MYNRFLAFSFGINFETREILSYIIICTQSFGTNLNAFASFHITVVFVELGLFMERQCGMLGYDCAVLCMF